MTDELLAYLLDDLCPERRAEMDRRLANEPALRSELARIKECLASTGDPAACADEPPRDLVTRTCCLVESVHDHVAPVASTSARAMSECGPAASCGSRWSMADYSVCAGVVGVLAMLMMPAMRESRDAARLLTCKNNLRALGTAVFDYTQVHGPNLPPLSADEPMGVLAAELVDGGGVDPVELAQSMRCPDSLTIDAQLADAAACRVPARRDLQYKRSTALKQLLACTSGIAIQAGYVGPDRAYHCAKFNARRGRPLAADAPALTAYGISLTSHGGQGANVLDEGLRVRFRSPHLNADENIYVNDDGVPMAGRSPEEVVLIRGDRWPVKRYALTLPQEGE